MKKQEQTFNRAVKFFGEINQIAKEKTIIPYSEVALARKRNATNSNFFAVACALGYYKRAAHGFYKINFAGDFQPIQVRNVINKCAEMYPRPAYQKKAKKDRAPKAKAPTSTVFIKPVLKKTKTASFFWGLIKFNY